jgi:hypothetical protein
MNSTYEMTPLKNKSHLLFNNMSQIQIDNKRSSLIETGLANIERNNTPNSF